MTNKPLFTLLVSLVLACGTDESEARFPVESGIDQARLLDSLSANEAQALCLATHEGVVQFMESDLVANYLCTLIGAFSATLEPPTDAGPPPRVDVAQCETIRKQCLGKPTELTRSDGEGCSFPRPCRVRVGELEMCSERYLETLATGWEAVSCESLAQQPRLTVPIDTVSNPSDLPGCEQLNRECPRGTWPAISPVTITREPVIRMR